MEVIPVRKFSNVESSIEGGSAFNFNPNENTDLKESEIAYSCTDGAQSNFYFMIRQLSAKPNNELQRFAPAREHFLSGISGFDIESQNDPVGRGLAHDDVVDPIMYNDPEIEHLTRTNEEFSFQL